jgi:hypothetical protein
MVTHLGEGEPVLDPSILILMQSRMEDDVNGAGIQMVTGRLGLLGMSGADVVTDDHL